MKPYYAESQSGVRTEQFETMAEAIAAGQEAMLAPFTVYQLMPQPVGQRLANTDGTQLGRMKNDQG